MTVRNLSCLAVSLAALCLCVALVIGQESSKSDQRTNRLAPAGRGQQSRNYPPEFADAKTKVYKTIGDVQLRLYIFNPDDDHQAGDDRPAAVFFFGGGWRSGTPAQFEQHCRYLASRGMVAMTADYRVASRHKTKADACVADGKSAIRWVRTHAKRLGVDPQRILAGGGSAGGHVAACTGVVPGFEDGDTNVSSQPNAMALFNPALVLSSVAGEGSLSKERLDGLRERLGVKPEWLSPYQQLKRGMPPTIIFHGKADSTVPFRTAEIFTDKAKANGDEIRLVAYDGQGHGFFNYGREDNKMFVATVKELDDFLVGLGYLSGEATIANWK